MNAQPAHHDTNAQPLHDLDYLVGRLLDLKHEAEEISSQMEHVKDQIRAHGIGQHPTANGVTVTVQAPSRRFNPATAAALLPAETLELCGADGYDPKKLKAYLSPVLLEQCMDTPANATTIVKVDG